MAAAANLQAAPGCRPNWPDVWLGVAAGDVHRHELADPAAAAAGSDDPHTGGRSRAGAGGVIVATQQWRWVRAVGSAVRRGKRGGEQRGSPAGLALDLGCGRSVKTDEILV